MSSFGPAARDAVAISIKLHRPTAQRRVRGQFSNHLDESSGLRPGNDLPIACRHLVRVFWDHGLGGEQRGYGKGSAVSPVRYTVSPLLKLRT